MDIDSIRDRTFENPVLNLQETNALLAILRNLVSTRRVERTSLGSTIFPDVPYIGTIKITFKEDMEPNSVFPITLEVLASLPTVFSPFMATADSDYDSGLNNNNTGDIYCTNGPFSAKAGTSMDCFIIGDDVPQLVKYQLGVSGTEVPHISAKVHWRIGYSVEFTPENENVTNQFICVSEPDTAQNLIWVIRSYSAEQQDTVKPLMLMRAHNWMNVGGAVEVSIWNAYDGDWEPDAQGEGGVPIASAIAQDVGNRNFLKPSDLCWGRWLGTTKASSSSDDDSVDVYEIIGENGLHQVGKALAPVDCGQSADFEITCGDPEAGSPGEYFPEDKDLDMSDYTANDYLTLRKELSGESVACPGDIKKHSIQACTPSKGCVRHIFEGEFAKLRYITSNRKWEARPVPDTLFAKGQLYAEMCPDNDGQIQNLVPYGCCAGQQTVTIPNGTALNSGDFKLAGKTGYNVFAVYSGVGNTWMIIQVSHEEVNLLEDLEVDPGTSDDCPAISGKKRKFALMTCEPSPEPIDLISFEKVDMISDITLGTCGLVLQKTAVCVASVGADSESNLDFQQVEVVTNVYAGPDCGFTIDKKLLCVAGSLGASPSLATLMTVDVDVVTSFETYDTTGDPSSAPEGGGTCQLLAKTKTIKVCGASEESPFPIDVITFQLTSVLYAIVDEGEGGDILQCWVDIFVPCTGGTFCDVAIEVDPCPTEGSSESPVALIRTSSQNMLELAKQIRVEKK